MSKKRIAVIGAGIAGLSCAYEFQKAGYEVIVYEKNADVGGRMATRVKDGLEFNSGATLLSRHYTTLRDYSKEFGIEWVPLQADRTHRVIRDGKAYPLGLKNPLEVLKLSVLSIGSRFRFLWFLLKLALRKVPACPSQSGGRSDFFDLSTTPDALDFDNASHYLRQAVGDEVVDYIADPFTATLHFYLSDSVSTAMMLTLLKSMVGNKEFSAEYPKGGVQAIPNALARHLTVVTNANISSVASNQNSRYSSDRWNNVNSGNGQNEGISVIVNEHDELFDAVVFACPAPAAKAMLTHPTPAQTELLESVSYGSTITLAFKVAVDLFADTTHCIYVPYVENKIVSSCIFEARKGSDLVKQGSTLFNVYLHDQAAKELMGKTDDEILRVVLPELKKVCPEIAQILHKTPLCTRESCVCAAPAHFHDIERWPCAMPKFPHGYVTKVKKFVQEHQGENGIYFIGDYMNSPWTEGAARSGKRLAANFDTR